VYESNSITVRKLYNSDQLQAHVEGNLSFDGITETHSFNVRVSPEGSTLRISGEFPLRQSDYGIKPVSFAAGALRLKDELKFRFELVARRQE
jgi:polyisoprenoid-binding protein YceI